MRRCAIARIRNSHQSRNRDRAESGRKRICLWIWLAWLLVAAALPVAAWGQTKGQIQWIRQFGSSRDDFGYGVAADASGNIYIAGYTLGALPSQTSTGWSDAFVRKYNASGTELWTRQFGSSSPDFALGVTADASGNVYVAGYTYGVLPGQISAGYTDAFVRKYDASGTELWTRQFGSSSYEAATGVAADASGNIYVAGYTGGVLPGQTRASTGYPDAFVRKYDASGTEIWTRQFGSSADDLALGVAADASGNVYVAGYTYGVLPGQTSPGSTDAFVRTYDASGTELWTHQFGSSSADIASGVTADASRNLYVAGQTYGTLPDRTSAGWSDAFVRKYDASGTELWTRQFGSASYEAATAVAADASGNTYVAGYTWGALPGQTGAGRGDAFVRKYDASGTELWTFQFGSSSDDVAFGVAADAPGNIYVAGHTYGALPGQISAGFFDAFVVKLVEYTPVAIDIKPGGFPNSINLGSGGSVPVAILSSATFDATTVNPRTVTLAGASVALRGNGTPNASIQDVNGDRRLDLLVHVPAAALQLSRTDTLATLTGQTYSGQWIQGSDSVRIVP